MKKSQKRVGLVQKINSFRSLGLKLVYVSTLLFCIPFLSHSQVTVMKDSVVVCSSAPTTINVLGNDDIRGCNNSSVLITFVSYPQHGKVHIDANNNVVYTSDSAWIGQDSFRYMVKCNTYSGEANVSITVLPTPNRHAINHVYCDEEITPVHYFTGDVPGTVFQWHRVIGQDVDTIGLSQTSGIDSMPSFKARNTGIYPIIAWYQVTPSYTANGFTCLGAADNYLITVNPVPVMADIASQLHCTGERVSAYEFTGEVPKAHYAWRYLYGDPLVGLPMNGNNQLPAYIALNEGTQTLSAYYEVAPSYAYANRVCPGIKDTFSVNILPKVSLSSNLVLPSICGTGIIRETLTSATSDVMFSWVREPNTGINEVAKKGIGNIITDTLTNNTNHIVNVRYAVTMSTPICSYTEYVTVSIYPSMYVTSGLQFKSCSGTIFQTTLTGNVLGSTFVWKRLPNVSVKEGATQLNSANITEILTNTTGLTTKVQYAITITANGCSQQDTLVVTLAPKLSLNTTDTVTIQVCSGNIFARNLTSSAQNVSFIWERVFNSNVYTYTQKGIGSPIVDSIINLTTVPQTVVYNVTLSNTDGCSYVQQIKTIVNPLPQITTPVTSVTMAMDGSKAIAVSGGVNAQVSSSDSNVVKVTFNATKDSIILHAKTEGKATITYQLENGIGCIGKANITVTVTKSPSAVLSLVGANSVCNGGTTTLEITDVLYGTAPWTIWLNYKNSGQPATVIIINSKADLPKRIDVTLPAHANTGVNTYYFSVDSIKDNSGSIGRANSGYIQIDVMPKVTVEPVANQILCNGAMSSPIYFDGSANVFNWTLNKNIGAALVGSGDIATFQAYTSKSIVDTATLTVTPEYRQGELVCKGTALTSMIIVKPMPKVNTISDTVVCANTVVTIPLKGNVTTKYRWTAAIEINLASGESTSALQFTAKNYSTAPITSMVLVTPVYVADGMECTGSAQQFAITVNPTPSVFTISDQDYCNGTYVPVYNFSSNTPGTQFNWRHINGTPITGLPLSGTGVFPAFIAQNTGTTINSGSYEVTASYAYANVSCPAAQDTFKINIEPRLSVGFVAEQNYCVGTTSEAILLGDTSKVTYAWKQIGGVNVGLPFMQGINVIPSYKAQNPSDMAQTAVIEVTPISKSGLCTGDLMQFSITVNPTVRLSSPLMMDSLCSGNKFNYTATSSTQGVYYQWQRAAISGINNGLEAKGQGAVIAEVLHNTTEQFLEVAYVLTMGYDKCVNHVDTVKVVVKPAVSLSIASETVTCNDAGIVAISCASSHPTLPLYYKVIFSSQAIDAGFHNNNSYELLSKDCIDITVPAGVTPKSYIGTVAIQSAGCLSAGAQEFIITIAEPTVITEHPTAEIVQCTMDTVIHLEVKAKGTNLTYQWYKDGQAIDGCCESTYKKHDACASDCGVYTVEVKGVCGTVVSKVSKVQMNNIVISQKWNDVLFVSRRDTTGNKMEFKSYQWYRVKPDGKLLAIADKGQAQYYSEKGLQGTFVVEVTYADGVSMMSCPYTVESSAKKGLIKIYPNPATTHSKVKVEVVGWNSKNIAGATLEVYDITGRVLKTQILSQSVSELDMNVTAGTYIVRVTDLQGNITTEKIIIK